MHYEVELGPVSGSALIWLGSCRPVRGTMSVH